MRRVSDTQGAAIIRARTTSHTRQKICTSKNMRFKKAYRVMYNGWAGNFRRNAAAHQRGYLAPLYSEKKSRPAESVNVLFSILLLAELLHTSSWEDIVASRSRSDVSIRVPMYLDTFFVISRPAAELCSGLYRKVCALQHRNRKRPDLRVLR